MTPATHNITAYIGATLGPKVFTFKDSEGAAVDLTGWSVWAHVKRTASDDLFLDLAPSITDAAFNTNGDQSEESDPVEWLGQLPEEPSEPEPSSGDRGFLFAAGRYWRTGIEDDDERIRITTWSSKDLNEWRLEAVCYQDKP